MNRERNHWRSYTSPDLMAWALYLLLVPFYVFKSGLPQPGDVLIVVLVPIALWNWGGRLPKPSREALRPLLAFTAWACLVALGWAVVEGNFKILGKDAFLLFPVYYVYNSLIFLVALVLYRRHGEAFLRSTLFAIQVTLVMLLVASVVMPQVSPRGTLFFQNPNQLGYWALLAACVVSVVHRVLGRRLLMTSLEVLACGYLATLSASRAAVAGIGLLLFFAVFSSPRAMVMASIAALAIALTGPTAVELVQVSQKRELSRRSQSMSFFEERGYQRLWRHSEYLVFGAGEGGLSRFDADSMAIEIHSTPGTIIFSYGVVGTILFVGFLWRIVKGAPLRASFILIPPLIYMAAHQGLRFTMLWVLLGLFVAVKNRPASLPASAPAVLMPGA